MSKILALGDCNTLGTASLVGNSYPERCAKALDKTLSNCGFTMATTNEMLYFYQDFKEKDTEIILIQYGLADSWRTFKYAPYVLYYPESKIRKLFRKIVKKYKKTAKKIGLNRLLGVSNVVNIAVYRNNIRSVIQQSQDCTIILISTIPNLDTSRNSEIVRYNEVLIQLSEQYENVYYTDVYKDFLNHPEYYLDRTHMNNTGYTMMAQKILEVYDQFEQA
ncbi:MAG: SGNH/GDSL hydrolase family protein [Campylobacterota bacterium]|nr:SGNH/GDSL hydrolase family protein [Campylobacterota bacterium]